VASVDFDGTHGMAEDTRSISVVIVDHHLLVAESMAIALAASPGISVPSVAGTAAEGLRETARLQPDVLLLDQRLPDGLGTDLIPDFLTASPATKVVMVTGETSDSVLFTAIERGCTGFVRKGARVAELVSTIQGVARSENMIHSDDLRLLMLRLRRPRRLGDDLTNRESDTLQLLVDGASTEGIASELVVAVATARNHVQAVLTKLGAHSRLEAVTIALREEISTQSD
jgi:DNA-binding NarL/FixJ family response regulator